VTSKGLVGGATTLEGLQPGLYHWQLASVRGDTDQGPLGRSAQL
jgi:hypothetical protein